MDTQTLQSRYLTIAAASHYVGLSPMTIRRLIADGKILAYRPTPGRILLDRVQLDRWVQASGQAEEGNP